MCSYWDKISLISWIKIKNKYWPWSIILMAGLIYTIWSSAHWQTKLFSTKALKSVCLINIKDNKIAYSTLSLPEDLQYWVDHWCASHHRCANDTSQGFAKPACQLICLNKINSVVHMSLWPKLQMLLLLFVSVFPKLMKNKIRWLHYLVKKTEHLKLFKLPSLVTTYVICDFATDFIKRCFTTPTGNILFCYSTHPKTFINDFIWKAYCLKYLGTLVWLKSWNTHFSHDLGNTSFHGITVILKHKIYSKYCFQAIKLEFFQKN